MQSNIRRDLRFGRRPRTLFTSGLLIPSSACGFAQPAPERQARAAGEARGIVGQPYSPELTEKAQTRPEGSGTVLQLDAGVHAIGKKLVEEAAESWMAAEHEGKERAAEEISQLLYHAQVLMIASGITLDDVYTHL